MRNILKHTHTFNCKVAKSIIPLLNLNVNIQKCERPQCRKHTFKMYMTLTADTVQIIHISYIV